jgi:hypothetical protein
MSKIKVNSKVSVFHETNPFTGVVEQIMKWENPFSVIKKKGIDYVVRADDDSQLYKCPEESVSKI